LTYFAIWWRTNSHSNVKAAPPTSTPITAASSTFNNPDIAQPTNVNAGMMMHMLLGPLTARMSSKCSFTLPNRPLPISACTALVSAGSNWRITTEGTANEPFTPAATMV
jgi:hypothetical protein